MGSKKGSKPARVSTNNKAIKLRHDKILENEKTIKAPILEFEDSSSSQNYNNEIKQVDISDEEKIREVEVLNKHIDPMDTMMKVEETLLSNQFKKIIEENSELVQKEFRNLDESNLKRIGKLASRISKAFDKSLNTLYKVNPLYESKSGVHSANFVLKSQSLIGTGFSAHAIAERMWLPTKYANLKLVDNVMIMNPENDSFKLNQSFDTDEKRKIVKEDSSDINRMFVNLFIDYVADVHGHELDSLRGLTPMTQEDLNQQINQLKSLSNCYTDDEKERMLYYLDYPNNNSDAEGSEKESMIQKSETEGSEDEEEESEEVQEIKRQEKMKYMKEMMKRYGKDEIENYEEMED